MIRDFLESWPLFQWTYLVTLLAATFLGTAGVLVVTRGQVFMAAAVSQASLLGLALNLVLGLGLPMVTATAFGGAAALATSRRRTQAPGFSGEETTGWLFLGCGSLAILALAHHPTGLKAVQSAMASSVMGATLSDALVFGALAILTLTLTILARRQLVLFILDPVMAAAVGMPVTRWAALIALGLGLGIGITLQATGLLFAFGCLVLPALVARNLCREISPMFWVSPVVAALSAFLALALAHRYNLPPGQVVVALLAALVGLAWLWRGLREQFLS